MANDLFSPAFVPPQHRPYSASFETLSPTKKEPMPTMPDVPYEPTGIVPQPFPTELQMQSLAADARAKIEAAFDVQPATYDEL